MTDIVIYYEYEPILGVNTTYHDGVQFHYDYFPSMHFFNLWIQAEFHNCSIVEVTNDNYQELKAKGAIS